MTSIHIHDHSFPTDTEGLPSCRPTEIIELRDGDTYELRIAPVANQLGDNHVRMLAYNGSIPGPTLRVAQGSEIAVRVRNDGDHDTTVHWHGLRLDNAYDGVPHETQAPIPVGGEFVYRLRVPDDGVYWYHPHVREDYGLEMGLYGNILVDPTAQTAWPAVNREAIITLDDVLIEDGRLAPFSTAGPTHTAMGRFGNVMLTGGATDLALHAFAGEVVRFYFTNTANTRIFNVTLPGARMKLVGGDSGRWEHEEWVESVLLALPSVPSSTCCSRRLAPSRSSTAPPSPPTGSAPSSSPTRPPTVRSSMSSRRCTPTPGSPANAPVSNRSAAARPTRRSCLQRRCHCSTAIPHQRHRRTCARCTPRSPAASLAPVPIAA
jgi:Multicopper oxidase